jgi:hypothetical protein
MGSENPKPSVNANTRFSLTIDMTEPIMRADGNPKAPSNDHVPLCAALIASNEA